MHLLANVTTMAGVLHAVQWAWLLPRLHSGFVTATGLNATLAPLALGQPDQSNEAYLERLVLTARFSGGATREVAQVVAQAQDQDGDESAAPRDAFFRRFKTSSIDSFGLAGAPLDRLSGLLVTCSTTDTSLEALLGEVVANPKSRVGVAGARAPRV